MPFRSSAFLLCSLLFVASVPLSAQPPEKQVPATPPTTNPSSAPAPAALVGTPLNVVERKALIAKARKAYYSLKTQGMQEYRFEPALDWEAFFDSIQADKVGREQLLPLIKAVKFQVIIGPTGASTVSHQSDTAPPNEEVANRLNQMIGGVERMLRGFVQTWSGYSISPLLPDEDSDFEVVDVGSAYRVTYKEGAATLVLTLRHDLAIEKLELTSAEVNATIHTTFEAGSAGFLLTGYEADYKEGDSNAHLKVVVQHGTVNGLQVPNGFQATTSQTDKSYTFSFTFSNPQIKKS